MKNILKFLVSVGGTLVVGFAGSLVTLPAIDSWYKDIQKPSFTPPNSVFGPVWTALYILIGIAVFLVWKKGWKMMKVRWGLGIFMAQLILNFLWSFIFFGLNNLGLATLEIGLLWLAILINIVVFYPLSKRAAWLMVPYLLWVSFASLLTFSVWRLNN